MKNLSCYLFLIVLTSLNSCKKSEDVTTSPKFSTDGYPKNRYYKSYNIVDNTTNIGFAVIDTAKQDMAFLVGGKDTNGNLTSLSDIVYVLPSKEVLFDLKISSDKLIHEAHAISKDKEQIVTFDNYDLTNGTVDIQITDKTAGTVIFPKKQIKLSSDIITKIKSARDMASSSFRGRKAAASCNEILNTTRAYLSVYGCVYGAALIPFAVAEGPLCLLFCPLDAIVTIFSCIEALDVYDTYQRGGCLDPTSGKDLKGLALDCLGSPSTVVATFTGNPAGVIGCLTTIANALLGLLQKLEENKKPNGRSTGDPHLATSDNFLYDFQGHGEFIVTKSTVDNFEVQVRQEDVNNTGSATLNTAVSVQTGSDIVCITTMPDQLYINNKPQDLNFNKLTLKDNAYIIKGTDQGLSVLDITTKNGDAVRIRFHDSYLLDYLLYLKDNRRGKMIGLMGNFDGNNANDLQIQNGTLVKNTFDGLYPIFANSWRIKKDQSLFYYSPGKSTDIYTKLDFPKSKAVLTLEAMQRAEIACRNAGITTEPFLTNCIYDIAVTNDNTLASSSLWGQQSDVVSVSATLPPSSIVTKFLDVKELTATYEVVGANLIVICTVNQDPKLVPSILVDVNQNGSLDSELDRSYGSYGTQYPNDICVQYLRDLQTTSYCGTPPTKATQTTDGKVYKFIIPISELNTTSGKNKASVLIKTYSPASYFQYYPLYSNSIGSYFSKTYMLNLN